MYAKLPFHLSETNEQNKHHCAEVKSVALKQMLCRKMRVRLNFIEDVLHMFTDYILARMVSLFQGLYCVQGKSEASPLKANTMQNKYEKMTLRHALHFSTHCSSSGKNVVSCLKGNIRQIATCKQHFPSTVIFLV